MGTLALFLLTIIVAIPAVIWWERRSLRKQIAALDAMEREWFKKYTGL